MKNILNSFSLICIFLILSVQTNARQYDWLLGMQSYTFNRFTLTEALDKTQELGIKYIEIYPGHKLGGKWGDKVFGPNLDEQTRREIKDLATSKGITIASSGVYSAKNPAEWENILKFAADMGMSFISCEPRLEDWDAIEELSSKYGVKVAVHNHPQPSTYWSPDPLLKAIDKRPKTLGASADVGHWRRGDLNEVECLKKLKGRVVSLHIKDIGAPDKAGGNYPDVIWGQGILDMPGMLKELKRQKFKGILMIEYETNWLNSVPDIKRSIEYFNSIAP